MRRYINKDDGTHNPVDYFICLPCHEIYTNTKKKVTLTIKLKTNDPMDYSDYEVDLNGK